MRRGTWSNTFAAKRSTSNMCAQTRDELSELDLELFTMWNLGGNILLGWTLDDDILLFICVHHFAIPDFVHDEKLVKNDVTGSPDIINEILSGPKFMDRANFSRVCRAFDCEPVRSRSTLSITSGNVADLVSDMVRCYGVSLVHNRAVVLLDIVEFSLQSALDQMAMLNSLAYSVNSAYGQLISKDVKIDFARTTTGDGFYIWNRATTHDANADLYKLLMMILVDNSLAQRKARGSWVPRLRAAFHVGEHYEFHQVEGLNPTNFSYIVGQVTVDLSRMVSSALPGQILLGDFLSENIGDENGRLLSRNTLGFVEGTAATLGQLYGLDTSGGRIKKIHCYLTGNGLGGGRFLVNQYQLHDKHNTPRLVYNAKINIHRYHADPIYLGIRTEDLWAFSTSKVTTLGTEPASSAAKILSSPGD